MRFAHPRDSWRERLREAVSERPVPLHMVGAGNTLRTDDGAGIEIISKLRSRLGPAPVPGLEIHDAAQPAERLISRLSAEPGRIMVFDAVEASKAPGEVVFCRLSDTKYGFFATHNVPMKLIPGVAARERDIYLVGVQPSSLEVGEGLTEAVRASVEEVVSIVARGVGERA